MSSEYISQLPEDGNECRVCECKGCDDPVELIESVCWVALARGSGVGEYRGKGLTEMRRNLRKRRSDDGQVEAGDEEGWK